MTRAIQRLHTLDPVSIEALCAVLEDCVDGGASVSFMAPLTRATARAFWQRVALDVEHGKRALLVARDAEARIVGTVQLGLDLPPNQPHRADVAKLLVQRASRRCGVAAQLMAAVETLAVELGRRVLVLDTVTGSDGERLYARLGWTRVGTVPDYALWPHGGYCSTTFFYMNVSLHHAAADEPKPDAGLHR